MSRSVKLDTETLRERERWGMRVVRLSRSDCEAKRQEALARLGMTLEQAHAQWGDCGCCLVDGNWHDLTDLEVVKEMDWLLDEEETRNDHQ